MYCVFVSLIKSDAGATAIEYGLIASLVAIAGIIAFTATGNTILSSYTEISDNFCSAVGGEFTLTETGDGSCAL